MKECEARGGGKRYPAELVAEGCTCSVYTRGIENSIRNGTPFLQTLGCNVGAVTTSSCRDWS